MLASCAVVALAPDAAAFLGGRVGRPRSAGQIPSAGVQGRTSRRSPAAVAEGTVAVSWLCFLPAVCLVAISAAGPRAAARCAPTPRRSRHVCRFFGGGGQNKKGEKGEAQSEEAPAEAEAEEELSEAAAQACEKLRAEIEELKAHAEDKKNAHERLKLEVENFRARTRQELSAARGKAAIPVIKELLPIADEFDLARQNLKIETEGEQAVSDRFETLFSKMMDMWRGLGVTKLEAVGQPFNPELHEAVSMIPSEEYGPEVVCNELRGGWVLNTPGSDEPQVLRAALVCVSSGPGPS